MSQFLLVFDRDTIFKSFFVKIKAVTEHPNVQTLKEKNPKVFNLFLDTFKIKYEFYDNFDYLDHIYQNKAIYIGEFSKILTISFGYFDVDNNTETVKKEIKSIIKKDEIDTIKLFWEVLDRKYRSDKNTVLVGYNFDIFDIPIYIKRLLKYKDDLSIEDSQGKMFNLGIPTILKNTLYAKPWEQLVIDTAQIWKFGDINRSTINQIANFLNYERNSDEILDENVNEYYWGCDDKEQAMVDIAMVGRSDIEIMMDFMTEMRTV